MNSLFSEQEIGFDFIGAGLALKKTSDNNVVHLYKDGRFVKEQLIYPVIEKRLFVVDLIERLGVTTTKLAASLNISRQSIRNWLNTYRKYGSEGLVNSAKDSWKKNRSVLPAIKPVSTSSSGMRLSKSYKIRSLQLIFTWK